MDKYTILTLLYITSYIIFAFLFFKFVEGILIQYIVFMLILTSSRFSINSIKIGTETKKQTIKLEKVKNQWGK